METQFQERIARAKEAARLASIAAMARGPSDAALPLPPAPPAPRGLPRGPPPFAEHGVPPFPPRRVDEITVPDAVRHRIDRLVEFIARNGPAFEATARERERVNPDFAFLHAGAPYHDYFVWKKNALATASLPPAQAAPPRPLVGILPSPARPLDNPAVDPILSLSVGAMANACNAVRARGLPAYSPLPLDLLVPAASSVPPVEPARLEARLAEYYRSSVSS